MNDMARTDRKKNQMTQVQRSLEPASDERLFIAPADIREINDGIILTADMPGVEPDGVEVTLERNVLTIRGTIADEFRPTEVAAHTEYEAGSYERSFTLSGEINRDGIEASMNNGVLTLTLPKTTPSQRKIEVKAG